MIVERLVKFFISKCWIQQPFGFSRPHDLQILVIFYLWNSIPFGAFWGVLMFEVLDSAANSVGNIDIISCHLAFPSHMILQILAVFYFWNTIPFDAFWGSDVLSVGFSS